MTTQENPWAAFIKNSPAETPVVETTEEVIEAPVEETPAVEPEVVEAPVVETPVVKEPVVETKIVDSPKSSFTKDVVLYSIKDLDVKGLGKLSKGYTKVSPKDADKWLEFRPVRIASKEEINTYFNK